MLSLQQFCPMNLVLCVAHEAAPVATETFKMNPVAGCSCAGKLASRYSRCHGHLQVGTPSAKLVEIV